MTSDLAPTPHPDPWVNLIYGYVTEVTHALESNGLHVHRSWLDPSDPRDATVVYAPPARRDKALALVWDEERGWLGGYFEAGRTGVRTTLSEAAHVGGGVLPSPQELADRVVHRASSAPRLYRSHMNVRDGLEDALRAYRAREDSR